MKKLNEAGQIVILNGPPRSGKSSIATAIQDTFEGVWMNLGVDRFKEMTPRRYQPGIGLRPGGESPELEPLVVTLYTAMYESIAAHSRLGLNVVADVAHHDRYSVPRNILACCARTLQDLPVIFVGVRCPSEVIRQRRRATWGGVGYNESGLIADPVSVWETEVHTPGIYDIEVDTSTLSPHECADRLARRLRDGPPSSAFRQLA